MDNFINKVKNAVSGNKDEKEQKSNTKKQANFAGYSNNQIEHQKRNASNNNSLSPSTIASEAKDSLDEYKSKNTNLKISSSASISDVIATIYSEGNIQDSLDRLRRHLNENKGSVDKKYWYMLMDFYQISEEKEKFEKTALSFATLFGASPPSWEEKIKSKDGKIRGGNRLILPSIVTDEEILQLKDFFKSAKSLKTARINLSQCQFEKFEITSIKEIYNLFIKLRKNNINVTLMGDNNLINFCKLYINPDENNDSLNSIFIENENIFWLLYLELLQWKGKLEEFEDLAFEYAVKFEESPLGWENSGIMKNDEEISLEVENNLEIRDKIICSKNIDVVLNIIKNDLDNYNKSEIELSHVERIDMSGIGIMNTFIRDLFNEDDSKEIIIKYPNEMVLTLLEMTGLTNFVSIIPKKR